MSVSNNNNFAEKRKKAGVFLVNGQLFFCKEGEEKYLSRLDFEEKDLIEVEPIVWFDPNDDSHYFRGGKAEMKILKHGKGEKKVSFKMKAKKRSRKKTGFRVSYTKVVVSDFRDGKEVKKFPDLVEKK